LADGLTCKVNVTSSPSSIGPFGVLERLADVCVAAPSSSTVILVNDGDGIFNTVSCATLTLLVISLVTYSSTSVGPLLKSLSCSSILNLSVLGVDALPAACFPCCDLIFYISV